MFAALICDLDNTLFDPRQIRPAVLEPALRAVREANARAGANAVAADVLEAALAASWRSAFDEVAREFALPMDLRMAWTEACSGLEVDGPLDPYPDIEVIAALPMRRFLVTTGFQRFQRSKVAALNLHHMFETVYWDSLDGSQASNKQAVFQRIIADTSLPPERIAVLGDNAASEIAAARHLGMIAIQVLREGVSPAPHAHHRIHSLWNLPELLGVSDSYSAS